MKLGKNRWHSIDSFRKRFVYKSDGRFDTWRILKTPGRVEGDCDDFAVTMLWLVSDQSMFTFWKKLLTGTASFWYCVTAGGENHVTLKVNDQYIDNIYPAFSSLPKHKMLSKASLLQIAVKMLLGKLTRN